MHPDSLDRTRHPVIDKMVVLTTAIFLCMPGQLLAEKLIEYRDFQASTSSQFECGTDAVVRLDAPSEEHFRRSRVERQELANLVRSYIWIDCPKIENIHFKGYTEKDDKPVFEGVAKRSEDWFLNEGKESKDESRSNVKTPSTPKSTKQTSKTLEALEAKAAKGDEEAMLELARGLIGKAPTNSPIKFETDRPRGVDMLEQLVSKGNAEALHLLAEAYLEDANLPINLPLISQATKMEMKQTTVQRESIASQMTLNAAANGSKGAVAALNTAGKAGSAEAFLALAQMYTRDEGGDMPYDSKFLKQELGMNKGYSKEQHHKVGLEFFAKASEAGSEQATQLLKELGMNPTQSNKTASSKQTNPAAQQANSKTNQQNLANALPALIQQGTVEDILEQRASGSLPGTQTGSSTVQTKKPGGGGRSQNGQGRGVTQAGAAPGKGKGKGKGQSDHSQRKQSVSKPGSHSPQLEPLIID